MSARVPECQKLKIYRLNLDGTEQSEMQPSDATLALLPLRQRLLVCFFALLLLFVGALLKTLRVNFHEFFGRSKPRDKKHSIRFLAWSINHMIYEFIFLRLTLQNIS